MNRKPLMLAVAAVSASLALSACGSSGSSGATAPSASSGDTVASKLIMGGPPEFKTRVDGLPGLKKNYGVVFKDFKPLDAGGPLTVQALKNGQVDVADIFTTDPSIEANGFVVLDDPKSNFAAQNVVPLINESKATPAVKQILNAISAKLDTEALGELDTKVQVDKQDPVKVADEWLAGAGIDTSASAAGVSLTVGSANFQENVVLADIYAAALSKAGAKVSKRLNIGSRETYIPGLKDGSIDLIPEYSGTLLQYLDKDATATTPDEVYTALQKAVPAPLTVLDKSAAQDKDAIVVTKQTAEKYDLKSIADLANKSTEG